jgi:hypothetical protein
MLIQANSGGGKSYCVRRICEQSYHFAPQIIFDVEGEFHTLREKFDYILAAPKGGDCVADIKSAAATWPFRSIVLSECRPNNTMPTPPKTKRQGGQQSGLGVTHAKAFDDGRQEEGNAVACRVQTKINQSAEQNPDIRKRLKQRKMLDLFLVSFFGC